MAELSSSVRTAWEHSLAVNLALVDHLEPSMMPARTPGGGYTVAQHLAEMVGATKNWGARLGGETIAALPDLYDPEAEGFVAEHDLARIRDVLERTTAAALEAAEAHPNGADGSPHTDGNAFLIHMMVHEAHHRGQLLLALKTNGHPLPPEEPMWAPWRS